jgi:ankyrin repeat protein
MSESCADGLTVLSIDGELHQAIKENNIDRVELLLSDPNLEQVSSWLPAITQCAKLGCREILELLLSHSKLFLPEQAPHLQLNEAIYWAARQGHADIIHLLLAAGASINPAQTVGSFLPPLLAAAAYSTDSIVTLLLELGANIEAADSQGMTPLMRAAARGQTKNVQLLLQWQAKTEALDQRQASALSHAARQGHVECVKLLLNAGAKIHTSDKHGSTPLHRAVRGHHLDVCKVLLAAGADKCIHDEGGNSPLYLAAVEGQDAIIDLLSDSRSGYITNAEKIRTQRKIARMCLHESLEML